MSRGKNCAKSVDTQVSWKYESQKCVRNIIYVTVLEICKLEICNVLELEVCNALEICNALKICNVLEICNASDYRAIKKFSYA